MKGIKLLRNHEPLWTEFWSAVTTIVWAKLVWFAVKDLDETPSYKYLNLIISDESWATIAFLIGLFQLISVWFNYRPGRLVMAFFASSFWGCLGYGLWLGNNTFPGAALYFVDGMAANMASIYLLSVRKKP